MTRRLSFQLVADWDGLERATILGTGHAQQGSAGAELFSLSWDDAALSDEALTSVTVDPHLRWGPKPQYPPRDRVTFGVLQDISPDRWGRMLMERRRERERRAGRAPASARMLESDFLLGVHDLYRLGGIRLRRETGGPFLDDQHELAAPPMVRLSALEAACRAVEEDAENAAEQTDEWLQMLIAPGGSLGGARPKASVVDEQGALWIAKFPSVRDHGDVCAWELTVHTLAKAAGIRVPTSRAQRFGSAYRTFLVKRFDRTPSGRRLHMASAMTLTGHQDGDDADTGASYLELADVLVQQGAEPAADLLELWRRIVINLLVSNTDDHLRNHAYVLDVGAGWRLAPAYDMNPDPSGRGHTLSITESDNAPDLALEVAPYFRIAQAPAKAEIAGMKRIVRSWRSLATELGIPSAEQRRMEPSFRLAMS